MTDIEKVSKEYKEWEANQYGGLSMEERQELGAFYTPPELSVKMVEKFGAELKPGKTLLDPTCGAGGLLAAAIIMGRVNPQDCYGIEFEPKIVKICQDRLSKLGVPRENIRQGDALKPESYTMFFKDENGNYKSDCNELKTLSKGGGFLSKFGPK